MVRSANRPISIQQDSVAELSVRVVAKRKISTVEGDHFNAGYCLGMMLGLAPEDYMISAMACSRAYVQNGGSASIPDPQGYKQIRISEIN